METGSAGVWRGINARYNLIGSHCKNCSTAYFPARIVCKKCGRNTKMEEKKFSGNGTIYSFTRIYSPPEDFRDEAPYTVAIVKLDEGPMVEGHIVEDGSDVKIGARVRPVFRKMFTQGEEGLIHYHFKFEIA